MLTPRSSAASRARIILARSRAAILDAMRSFTRFSRGARSQSRAQKETSKRGGVEEFSGICWKRVEASFLALFVKQLHKPLGLVVWGPFASQIFA